MNSNPYANFFVQNQKLLSDSLVRPVLPRSQRHVFHIANFHAAGSFRQTTREEVSKPRGVVRVSPSGKQAAAQRRSDSTSECRSTEISHRPVSYYDKQRDMLLQLEKNVSRLREEVRHLKCIRRDVEHVRSFGRNSRTTVAKMFTLLDTNFRSPWRMQSAARYLRHAKPPENVFALQSFAGVPDFGDLYGMTALIMHLRCYWYYFKDSTIQLQRVDLKAPGVIIATARITVTISDLTLQELFPHLRMTKRNREVNDVHRPSRERLLGRRFHCQCVITFFLDKESSRVAYISTSIDLVGSLLHSLA